MAPRRRQITGGIYFQEFSALDTKGAGLFACGVAIMFFGLYLLAPVPTDTADQTPEELAAAAALAVTKQCATPPHAVTPRMHSFTVYFHLHLLRSRPTLGRAHPPPPPSPLP